MARPGVPYEAVVAYIAEQTEIHGSIPSIANIIAECGGSATTITKYRQRYVSGTTKLSPGEPLPAPFEEAIRQNATSLWMNLLVGLEQRETSLEDEYLQKMALADTTIEESKLAKRDSELLVEQMQLSLDDYRQKVDTVTAEKNALVGQLANTKSYLAIQKTRAENDKSQLETLTVKFEQAEQNAEDRIVILRELNAKSEDTYQRSIHDLKTSHDQTIAEFTTRETAVSASNSQLQLSKDKAFKTIDALKKTIQELERSNEGLQSNLGDHQNTIQRLNTANKALSEKLENSDNTLIENRAAIATLKAQFDATSKSLDRQINVNDSTVDKYEKQISMLRDSNNELNNFIKQYAINRG